jgi:hypothetical protein
VKKTFLHITSIFLAVLVLFSTFSFTVEKHLCGGEIADYSFVGNLERCEMANFDHNTSETSLNQIPCCQDIVETINSSNNELTVVKEIDVEQLQFITTFVYTYTNRFEGFEQHVIAFKDYLPPLITRDISVLYDIFLI